jgi:hypothetical protein
MATSGVLSSTETPCDFLEFLAQERGTTPSEAAALVGQWLLDYEPGELARSRGARPRVAAPRREVRTKTATPVRRAA